MSEADEWIEKARRALDAARLLLDSDFHAESASRAYYAMFYAAQAALNSEGIAAKTHKGTHAMFGKHFVKTGALPVRLGSDLGQLFKMRQHADYSAPQEASAEVLHADAAEALEKAEHFVAQVASHLRERS